VNYCKELKKIKQKTLHYVKPFYFIFAAMYLVRLAGGENKANRAMMFNGYVTRKIQITRKELIRKGGKGATK
jgi:hypothetical protein